VRVGSHLPPGGAILVSVHHNGGLLAAPTFAARSYRLGTIVGTDPVAFAHMDGTFQIPEVQAIHGGENASQLR